MRTGSRSTRRFLFGLALLLPAFSLEPGCARPCPAVEPCSSCPEASGHESLSHRDEMVIEPTGAEGTAEAGVRDDGVVRLEGTPEIPAALHARLQQYLETRTATFQDISADGTSVLLTTRFAETAQVHLVSMPMGDRRQLTFDDEPVAAAAFVPGEPGSLVVMADIGGSENYQLYRFDRETGRRTLLTDGTHRHPEMLLSRSGLLVYTGNARNGRDLDLYVARPAAGPTGFSPGERFLERSGDWHVLDVSRDGRRMLIQEYVSILDARVYVVDVATREVRRISREGSRTSSDREAVFSADGARAYIASDHAGEHVALYEVELAHPEREWRALAADVRWDVEELSLSPDGQTLAFTANEDGISVLRLLDLRTRRANVVTGLPRGVISGLRFASEAPVVGFTVTSATSTGDVWTVAVSGRRATRWTESEIGGLDPDTLVEPSLVRVRSFDGREVPCFAFVPRGAGPFPVVVWIHGGPEAQSRPWFYPLAQLLAAEAGIAVLMPNVRGSDGYGRTYLGLDDGPLREDSVRDIGALLDWIGTRREYDSSRVAVYGGSYGGYMVLSSLTHYSSRLRAGVEIVGIANFVTFLENTAEYRRDLRRAEYGDERDEAMRARLVDFSPIGHVADIGVPLFVAHGANDPRVPVGEAEQIVRAVRESGHEVWYMLARNEGHGFRRKENRDVYTELAALFLARHLGVDLTPPPPAPPPAPTLAENPYEAGDAGAVGVAEGGAAPAGEPGAAEAAPAAEGGVPAAGEPATAEGAAAGAPAEAAPRPSGPTHYSRALGSPFTP